MLVSRGKRRIYVLTLVVFNSLIILGEKVKTLPNVWTDHLCKLAGVYFISNLVLNLLQLLLIFDYDL